MEALQAIEARLADLSAAWIQAYMPKAFLVDLKIRVNRPEPEIYLRVDTDSGITLDQCVRLHLYLREKYAQLDWLPPNYGITVSSPGVGSPLKLRRQYHAQKGRFLAVRQTDGQWIRGRLLEVSDEGIRLETRRHPVLLPWERIEFARVEVNPSRKRV